MAAQSKSALPPHWLDQVIGDTWQKDAAAVAQAVAKSPQFLAAIQAGIDKAKAISTDPKVIGEVGRQDVRVAIVDGVTDPEEK